MPSLGESFGLSIIEAQAMGVPVVASSIDSISETLDDNINGLLFKKEITHDLAEKVSLLYGNEDLRIKIINHGIDNVKKYSLGFYVSSLMTIYE